jgi:uncharacterized protein YceK
MTKSISAALIAMVCLSGCATVSSRCPVPTPISPATQARAAIELEALPGDSAIVEVLEAAALDRDKIRFCNSVEGR